MSEKVLEGRKPRRYIVKGYAGHPVWSGCTWANSCVTLQAAEALFAKKASGMQAGAANADAILLIDRQERRILKSVGTDDPVKLANAYGRESLRPLIGVERAVDSFWVWLGWPLANRAKRISPRSSRCLGEAVFKRRWFRCVRVALD